MQKINKQLYKGILILLKILPFVICLMYMISTICGFFSIELIIIGYISHLSILSWLFLYLASYVFQFCTVHRLPLYYIALNDALVVSDNYIGIPLDIYNLFILHLLIIGVFIFLILYFHQKEKRDVKDTKKSSSANHR